MNTQADHELLAGQRRFGGARVARRRRQAASAAFVHSHQQHTRRAGVYYSKWSGSGSGSRRDKQACGQLCRGAVDRDQLLRALGV